MEEIHTPKGILLPEGFGNLRGVGNNNRKGVGKPYPKVMEIIKKVEEVHTSKGKLLPEGFRNLRGVGIKNRKGVGKPYREGYGNN